MDSRDFCAIKIDTATELNVGIVNMHLRMHTLCHNIFHSGTSKPVERCEPTRTLGASQRIRNWFLLHLIRIFDMTNWFHSLDK